MRLQVVFSKEDPDANLAGFIMTTVRARLSLNCSFDIYDAPKEFGDFHFIAEFYFVDMPHTDIIYYPVLPSGMDERIKHIGDQVRNIIYQLKSINRPNTPQPVAFVNPFSIVDTHVYLYDERPKKDKEDE